VALSIERRHHRRFVYEADISHDLLARHHIYKGKLYNFSKSGLYFESDQTIYPGEEVFIKFEDQPDSINEDMMAQLPFGVEVVWQNDRTDSSFRYGYGAHYLDINDSLVKSIKIPENKREKLLNHNLETEKDPRAFPRRQYHKLLILSYKSKHYKAEFKDISKGGGFIKSGLKFTVGKQIRLIVPGSKIRKKIQFKGWIVRINAEGFGVKFDRRPELEVRKKFDRRTGLDRRTATDRQDSAIIQVRK
jgi:Tfp pilus assembly protein PilZ